MNLNTQFLLINGHFTLLLSVALVTFAISWLYFDAWKGRKDKKEGTKALGFLSLSLSFIFHSVQIDQSFITSPILGSETLIYLTSIFRIFGYITLIYGQMIDPLQPLPAYRKGKGFGLKTKSSAIILPLMAIPLSETLVFSFPLLAILTGYFYLRRATVGLEHHLKPISYSFFTLALFETLSLATVFRGTTNIIVSNLVAPFGVVWFFEHILLIIAIFVLGRWIWGYLLKRLETQLLMIFTTGTLFIFLVTTVFFTMTSIINIRESVLENLKTSIGVLNFSIESKKGEILSNAQVIAQNESLVTAVVEGEKRELGIIVSDYLLTKKQSFLVVVDGSGKILARADDVEKVGGSLSEDSLVKKALLGEDVSSVVSTESTVAPEVSVRSATPIVSEGEVIGAVVMGDAIDNAFVDGLKTATGLDASIYGGNVRSATTFVAADGKSRWIGIKEETKEIKETVLIEGKEYLGSVNILNLPYYASYTPLKDVDSNPVGMLFVGTPQVSLLRAASKSIELTFLVTAFLLMLSVFPAYYVSKYIIDQIH